MKLIDYGICDCMGFEILGSWSLDPRVDKNDEISGTSSTHWGFLICTPSPNLLPGFESEQNRFYGVLGSLKYPVIQESSLGILIKDVADFQSALAQFALGCGLSIIKKAHVELGDAVVVAGTNPLALSVLISGRLQGAMTVCLVSKSTREEDYMESLKAWSDEMVFFDVLYTN